MGCGRGGREERDPCPEASGRDRCGSLHRGEATSFIACPRESTPSKLETDLTEVELFRETAALSLISTIPLTMSFFALQKYCRNGLSLGSVKLRASRSQRGCGAVDARTAIAYCATISTGGRRAPPAAIWSTRSLTAVCAISSRPGTTDVSGGEE